MNEQSREATEVGSERTSARNADPAPAPQKPPERWDDPTREADGHRATKHVAWRSWAF